MRDHRSLARQAARTDPARYFWDDVIDDMAERLAFVRHQPKRSFVPHQSLFEPGLPLISQGDIAAPVAIDLEQPFAAGEYDFIGILGQMDAINDLPGALIHIRNALTPGGLAIVSFIGGTSLSRLRAAMLAADGERPAARVHPMVDPRAAPGLLQRAGWKDPVVDTHTIRVRYSSLDALVHDLRDQGLSNALCDPGPPLGKAALARARAAFLENADTDGKVTESFQIITLTGRRSLAGT